MNDGWDDDDDDVNVDDLFLEDWGGGEQDPTTAPASRMMDEDDLGNSTSNVIDAPRTDGRTDATQQDQSDEEEEEVEDDDGGEGWDDDDDLDLNFSEHNNDNLSLNNVTAPPAGATTTTAVKQSSSPPATASLVEDGWGDDEDDDLEFSAHSNENDNMMVLMNQQTNRGEPALLTVEEPQISKASTFADAPADDAPGWGEDDLEGFDFSETSVGGATAEDEKVDVAAAVVENNNNNNIAPFAAPSSTPAEQQWIQELTHYLETLPAHAQSITAVLEAEYNTPAKAFELQQYYHERPQLLQYTVEKELTRMEYTLITSTGDIVTDPTEIAQHFLYHQEGATASQPLLTPRCANQSLLADIVQVLTGPDRLVRPQYLCAAVASQCKLRVDLTQHVVEIVAALDLSLPTTTASRWKIAELAVVIVFVCPPVQQPPNSHHRIHEPFVEYRLAELRPTVKPATDPDFQQQLRSTVAFLMDMESAFESEEDRMDWQQPQQPNINFRDAYLQQSRRLQQDAVDGLKSAWQDLNTATGLGDKFRRLPSFLPERDVLDAAALAQEQHQAVLLQQQQQPQQRPTSILGGFVRSLAKSVALPDEDPNLYQDWNANNNINSNNQRRQPSPVAPKLYNTSKTAPPPVSTTTIPHLYRKDDNDQVHVAQHSSLPKSNTIPRLYHRQNSPPLDTNHREEQLPSDIPRLYHRETPQPNAPHNSNIISFEPTSRSKDDESGSVRPNASIQQEDAEELSQQEGGDGWGHDDLDVDDDDATDPLVVPSTTAAVVADDRLRALKDWTYDPETDVIPTRRRWINPLPGRVRMLQ